MQLDLSGKRAVVTGASLGIGAATVRLLCDMRADVHHVSNEGGTAAQYCQQFGGHRREETLSVLKEYGAR